MKLLVATSNPKKLKEIERILGPLGVEVLPPPKKITVEETGTTFAGNAYLKAKAYWEAFRLPALADDSGLVVEELYPYPGIYSARFYQLDWGGREEGDDPDQANNRKLLRLLKGKKNRKAYFLATVILYWDEKALMAEGKLEGTIAEEPRGEGGFGYDPLFVPLGETRTLAQMSPQEKDAVSHRGKALRKLAHLLKNCDETIP
ncbi:MAG: RdgB/HAM1 family non-canonical purine NTP pyrophosphatase [Aquificae bacterium]|nr:RdgB/HAM1 family non-canonical purine NTP pyrophosphatase [Aquificota bacterium]